MFETNQSVFPKTNVLASGPNNPRKINPQGSRKNDIFQVPAMFLKASYVSNEESGYPGCLGYMSGMNSYPVIVEIINIINHEIRIQFLNNQDSMAN